MHLLQCNFIWDIKNCFCKLNSVAEPRISIHNFANVNRYPDNGPGQQMWRTDVYTVFWLLSHAIFAALHCLPHLFSILTSKSQTITVDLKLINFFFFFFLEGGGLLFTSHWLNLQHCSLWQFSGALFSISGANSPRAPVWFFAWYWLLHRILASFPCNLCKVCLIYFPFSGQEARLSWQAYSLLHDDVLVDDVVVELEALDVEEVDVASLCAEEELRGVWREAAYRDLLQPDQTNMTNHNQKI